MNDAVAADPPLTTQEAGSSRRMAITLLVVGLVGMFLSLWGWAAVVLTNSQWWTDRTVLGLSGWVPFVVGLVLVVGAAIADVLLGRRADVSQVAAGAQATTLQTLLNRLAPWILVVLTAIGVLLVWLRYR